MWIGIYNPKGVGDVLLLTRGELDKKQLAWETMAGITRLYNRDTDETMAYNFHDVSKEISLEGQGQVELSQSQLDTLNQRLYEQGFETIELNTDSRLVVGEVKTCVPHENSDHLSITETEYAPGKTAQIVCGAANVRTGMKVVVALPGAVMPDGLVIWPGELRGVESKGMLCSQYELGLDPEHRIKGIAEVKANIEVGTPFNQLTSVSFVSGEDE